MKFETLAENELGNFDLLPDGTYPFTTIASEEIASKSEKNRGKMMFAIKLNVHGQQDRHVYDYFSSWLSPWKLRHFADTTGHMADYEKGEMDGTKNAFQGWVGYVKIGHKDANGKFSAKNTVEDYIVREVMAKRSAGVTTPAKVETADLGDDVPF